MPALKFWGSQFLINTTTQDIQHRAKLHALKDGRFLAVWENTTKAGDDPSKSIIWGQILNADGSKSGSEFMVNTTTGGYRYYPSVTVLNDGRFIVMWDDYSTEAGSVRLRAFNADGTPIGSDFGFAPPGLEIGSQKSITALSNGGFAIAYESNIRDIAVQSFDAALKPSGSPLSIVAPENRQYSEPTILALQGRFAVSFQHNEGDGTMRQLVFNNDGSRVSAQEAFKGSGGFQHGTTLSNGSTVLAWSVKKFEGGLWIYSIKAQILKPDGSPLGQEIIIQSSDPETTTTFHVAGVTPVSDGGFAVAYYLDPDASVSEPKDVYLAVFNSNGDRVGNDLLIKRIYFGLDTISLTTLEDGRIIVSWESSSGNPDPFDTDVHAKIIDPRQKALSLTGTTAHDQYIGTDFGDVLGGAGGADRLWGEGGNDTLDGGSGADILMGGFGDDLIHVDNAADLVTEVAGQGRDTVIVSASYALSVAAEIEVLKLTGVSSRASASLTGSATANEIVGHAGRTTIKAGSGNDKLQGGLGNDSLWGQGGKDVFVFDTRPNKSSNVDRIYDFRSADDSVYLDNKYFTKLGSGSLSRPKKFKSDMFTEGKAARDAEDRIVYDRKTGALYYDQDGTGSKAQVKIATITTKTKLYYHDFFVI